MEKAVFSDEVMEGAETFVDILDGLFKPSDGNVGPWRSGSRSTLLQEYDEEVEKMVTEGKVEGRKMENSRRQNGDKKRKKKRKREKNTHRKRQKNKDDDSSSTTTLIEEANKVGEGEKKKNKVDSPPCFQVIRVDGKIKWRFHVKPKEEVIKKDDRVLKDEEEEERHKNIEKNENPRKIRLILKAKPKEEDPKKNNDLLVKQEEDEYKVKPKEEDRPRIKVRIKAKPKEEDRPKIKLRIKVKPKEEEKAPEEGIVLPPSYCPRSKNKVAEEEELERDNNINGDDRGFQRPYFYECQDVDFPPLLRFQTSPKPNACRKLMFD